MARLLFTAVLALLVSLSQQGPRPDLFPCGLPAFTPILSPPKAQNRISGGWEVARHSFPWHVHIMIFETHSKNRGAQCGGSLIRPYASNSTDLVLTAAHCVVEKTTLKVVSKERVVVTVASHMRNDPERTRVKVKDLKAGNFMGNFGPNDIALLRLEKRIPYTKFTRPICLPRKDAPLPVGKPCYVSGHGALFIQSPSTPEELRMTKVEVWTKDKCLSSLDSNKTFDPNTQFCAVGQEQESSRKGDSGGALVCKENDRFIQYGIVSYGTEDLLHYDDAAKYTFVPKFIDWIVSTERTMSPTHEVMPEKDVHEYLTIKERNQLNLNRSKSENSLTGGRKAPPPPQRRPEDYKCGVPSPTFPIKWSERGFNRIAFGWEANKHSLPWTVLISNTDPSNPAGGNSCGGALIQFKPGNSTDVVLTAAHCLHDKQNKKRDPKNCKVFVGIHHQFSPDVHAKEVKVKQFAVHAGYRVEPQGGWHNDIALIKLEEAVPYTDFTIPICLPDYDERIEAGVECIIAGWGQTSHYAAAYESQLRMALVKTVSFEECKKESSFISDEETLCTKGENRAGFCHGDGGSPLVCRNKTDQPWTVYGIVSYSDARCARSFDKYTKVAKYVKWLDEQNQKLPAAAREFSYENIVEYLDPMELLNGPKRHTVADIPQSGASSSLPTRPPAVTPARPPSGSSNSPVIPGRPAYPAQPGRRGSASKAHSKEKGRSKERRRSREQLSRTQGLNNGPTRYPSSRHGSGPHGGAPIPGLGARPRVFSRFEG